MKVFVSSPINSLPKERKAVKKALKKMELEYFMSEYEGSRPKTPLEVCLEEVEKCPIYILLLGMKYGQIPEGYGKSITEMEFDLASKLNKKIFVYKIEFCDYEQRQQRFIEKVESSTDGLFRGAEIQRPHELKDRIIPDITNFLMLDTAENDTQKCIVHKSYNVTGKKVDVKRFASECGKMLGVTLCNLQNIKSNSAELDIDSEGSSSQAWIRKLAEMNNCKINATKLSDGYWQGSVW